MTTETIGCVKAATRILGDKWSPQLLRFLMNNETVRFCQIQDLVNGINPRTLSARLTTLEAEGVVEKVTHSDTTRCEYRLTEKGRSLVPILKSMNEWSDRYEAQTTTNTIV